MGISGWYYLISRIDDFSLMPRNKEIGQQTGFPIFVAKKKRTAISLLSRNLSVIESCDISL